VHALHCSVAQRSRVIPLSVSANSDESGKQSLYRDAGSDRHQNLIVCSLAHCQHSLKISCKSVRKFLRKVGNRQTNRQTSNDDYITSILGTKIKVLTTAQYRTCDSHGKVWAVFMCALNLISSQTFRKQLKSFLFSYWHLDTWFILPANLWSRCCSRSDVCLFV